MSNRVVEPLLLTIPECMSALRLSRSKVYDLIRRGKLPVRHEGRAARVHVRDLEAYADGLPAN